MSQALTEIPPTNSHYKLHLSDFIAGIFGGSAGVLVGHPFDTIKVRLQAENSKYKGTLDCFQSILKHEGVKGLYKGMMSPLVGVAGINALLFGVYGASLDFVSQSNSNPELSSIFIAGSLSGLVNSVFSCPMELIKIRLQNQKCIYKGNIDCIRQIWKSQGIKGLYSGFGVTVLRETPSYGVYFASYELLSRSAHDSTILLLIAGGMAGVLGWASTYPFDVVKTRIQSNPSPTPTSNSLHGQSLSSSFNGNEQSLSSSLNGKVKVKGQSQIQERGILNQFKNIYKSSGRKYSIFFRGLGATVLRAFPTNACTFYTVIWVKNYIEEYL